MSTSASYAKCPAFRTATAPPPKITTCLPAQSTKRGIIDPLLGWRRYFKIWHLDPGRETKDPFLRSTAAIIEDIRDRGQGADTGKQNRGVSAARFMPADTGPGRWENMPKETHGNRRTDASEKTKTNFTDETFRQRCPFHA